jgi:predicted PhzF superfamily epimerase YddE/YHI9
MTELQVLRVFCNAEGEFGNPLGVVLNGPAIPESRRQPLAAELGFSETIYIDDHETGRLQIFTPTSELLLAGHPLVGAAWLLARHTGRRIAELNPPSGAVPTWVEDGLVWIRGRGTDGPPWRLHQVSDPAIVDEMIQPRNPSQDADMFWAWTDQDAGQVRARVFASRYNVHEDEACGSACLLLAHQVGRTLTVHHGNGSLIQARPGPDGTAEIGGLVTRDHISRIS